MLKSPPREKRWVSWFYVVVWSLIIFVTIPFVRVIQRFVTEQWGRETFTYFVLGAIVTTFVASAVYLWRHRAASRSGYIWLLAVAAVFISYTINLSRSPEEAIHFIQYGLLGILAYRALTHHLNTVSIYFAAALICGIVGIVDELIQWVTPRRYWGLDDIWLNFFAGSLVQVGIAKGLNPPIIFGWRNRPDLQFLCRLAMVALVLLGASLINTPARIAWYTDRIPWLAFLKQTESAMLEYGYLYRDPDIGIFRSRLSPEELKQADRERGKEAADILDRFQDRTAYQEFLEIYTPVKDPFAHEARVHLFSRDHHFTISAKYRINQREYAEHLTRAFRENQIMEKYFPNTLRHSTYVWSGDESALARKHLLLDEVYESRVSRDLVTRLTESQFAWFFAVLLGGLALLQWHCGRDKSTGSFFRP